MAQHWPISPSGGARLVQCPASLKMQARCPPSDNTAAAEGTAAHWVLEQCIKGLPLADTAPNGVPVTEAMIEGAELAIDTMGLGVVSEQPVPIPRIHPDCGGTPDAYRVDGRTVRVWDYKFGFRAVEPFGNYQGAAYLAGVIGEQDLGVNFEFTIIQPRASHPEGPVRTWRGHATDLRSYVNRFSNAAHEAMQDSPPARTGRECAECLARHQCGALQRAGGLSVDMAGESTPLDLTDAALGREAATLREAADRLKARLTGLEAEIEARVRTGARVPGWGITHGRGTTVWSLPPATVIAMCGERTAKPVDVITPKQAIKAGVPEGMVKAMSEHKPGAASVDVVDAAAVARIFS